MTRCKLGSKILVFTLAVQSITTPCWAESSVSLLSPDLMSSMATGSEYVSGNYPGAILMPVSLWGSIGKPGIHHVPTQTDLVQLLSLAGGPGSDAELDHITIKRRSEKEEVIIRVNADDILNKPGVHSPILNANDIIMIPREKPNVSANTITTLAFISSVATILLAGFAISTQLKK